MQKYLLALLLFSLPFMAEAKNPIIPNQGVNDPHIRIYGDTAYLYATHDKSADNTSFIMEDWWVWSSKDLVNWTLENTLDPAETYIGSGFTSAWATDAATKDGKYYWYFSEANEQTGVVVSDTPIGPWKDALGGPLLTEEMTPTHEYDPGILKDGDDHYIVFGVFNYHIAKLGEDMMSLAEVPQAINVIDPKGPYTDVTDGPFAGQGTDDKPYLHKRGDLYYLSWGAFYATADNVYGPYTYRGTILNDESFKDGTESPTWPRGYLQGRHGSFFDWHGQSYFIYCDISQTDNRYFRDSFISYVHYRDDGTIAPIRVDLTGVGEYDPSKGPIEAEDYFAVDGFEKTELADGFGVSVTDKRNALTFPNIAGLADKSEAVFELGPHKAGRYKISIYAHSELGKRGKKLGSQKVRLSGEAAETITVPLAVPNDTTGLSISVKSSKSRPLTLDRFTLK